MTQYASNVRPSGPRRNGTLIVVGVVLVLGAVIWWATRGKHDKDADAGSAVPVVVATARQGAYVVYQSEPGTVTPANSVLVRSRVDGELTKVNFTGGQMVSKGDVLAEIDPRPLQSQSQLASSELARSQSQLANAQEILKHYQALLGQQSISPQRVADQQAQVNQYSAEVKANQARIDTAGMQLSQARIISPIDGMVSLRRVDPGNLVGPSDPRGIAVVTQSQPSKVVFSVPVAAVPRVLQKLRAGDCIPVNAYGDDPTDILATGHVLAANNQVDPATGTVKFEAEFANTDGSLLPSQFVTASLPVSVLPQATLIPAAAIQQGAAGTFVYVINDDNTASVTPVKVGAGDAVTTVIAAGIKPGVKVVVQGADRLRAGVAVKATADAAPLPSASATVPQCQRDAAAQP
jgi:multidrug efflux system membrane fusion protein